MTEEVIYGATEHDRGKLEKLAEIEGAESVEALLEQCMTDSVCPSICTSLTCDYTCEMEGDQDRGHCESCGAPLVKSALVLAGII